MYKLYKCGINLESEGVMLISENSVTSIPLDPANTDYANFKKEILADEAQLQDADGNTMTPEEAKAYVSTLP